jgi:hypothetical protein
MLHNPAVVPSSYSMTIQVCPNFSCSIPHKGQDAFFSAAKAALHVIRDTAISKTKTNRVISTS